MYMVLGKLLFQQQKHNYTITKIHAYPFEQRAIYMNAHLVRLY